MKMIKKIVIVAGFLHLAYVVIFTILVTASFAAGQYTDAVDMAKWYLDQPFVYLPLSVASIIFLFSLKEAERMLAMAGEKIFGC